MEKDDESLNQRIAQRVSELRTQGKLSLDALAERSGVSRSMISLIERGESNPTAVVLDRLASAFGVSLASLFDAPAAGQAPGPLRRWRDQAEWRDPTTGYVRRNLSPPHVSILQLVEVVFPGGQQVAFEPHGLEAVIDEQVWVLEGQMEIRVGVDVHRLHSGDCLAFKLDQPVSFHNPLKKSARYLVAIARTGRQP